VLTVASVVDLADVWREASYADEWEVYCLGGRWGRVGGVSGGEELAQVGFALLEGRERFSLHLKQLLLQGYTLLQNLVYFCLLLLPLSLICRKHLSSSHNASLFLYHWQDLSVFLKNARWDQNIQSIINPSFNISELDLCFILTEIT